MDVHRARDRRHPPLDLLRDLVVALLVAPHHLDIDRRRQTEVQNLIRDVRGLKEHRLFRETCRAEHGADLALILQRRRMMFLVQRDQDFAIAIPDSGAVAEGQVEAAGRQTDIVENGVDLIARNDAGGSRLPPARTRAPSLRCACLPEQRTCRRIWPESM